MVDIHWSDLAREDYWKNIEYLLSDWTEKEARDFIEKVDAVIEIIKTNPQSFQRSGYRNTHFVPITPQISMYYRIFKKRKIELVRFWNNHQNPKSLKINHKT